MPDTPAPPRQSTPPGALVARDSVRFVLIVAGLLAAIALLAWLFWPGTAGRAVVALAIGAAAGVLGVGLYAANTWRLLGRARLIEVEPGQDKRGIELQAAWQGGAGSRAVLDSASEAIVVVREGGMIELVNACAEKMFGYDRAELIGRPIEALIPEVLRGAHAQKCADYFRNPRVRPMGTSTGLIGRRRDGVEFPADISLSYFSTDDGLRVITFIDDITLRRQAEEALRAHSERLEEMVQERTQALHEAQAQLLVQQRLQQDLELAEQVQASLLPRHMPTIDGYDFAGTALPARYVGGDLYDFILDGPDTSHIVLADISGKGVAAALMTSTARAMVRAETEHERSPAAILANLNRALYQDLTQAEMFITVFIGRLDACLGRLTLANAGHMEMLWWRHADRRCRTVPATGLPVGIYPGLATTEEMIALRPGDVLVFYSDGLTEASDPAGELFGLERVQALLARHAHRPAAEIVRSIIEAVESFRANAPWSDDLTLVVCACLPRTVQFNCPATLGRLAEMSALIRQAADPYGPDVAYEVELAAGEIVTNVITHAYRSWPGDISGEIRLEPDRLTLDFYDRGLPFDPAQLPAVDLSQPHEGGYGLYIARQLSDELSYETGTARGNHWRLVRNANRPAVAGV